MYKNIFNKNVRIKTMSKRDLCIDWATVEGAGKKRRKLSLVADDEGKYQCLEPTCMKNGYSSQRGLRSHINKHHEYLYYFSKRPEITRRDAKIYEKPQLKAYTHKQPAFSVQKGCGLEFRSWLSTPFGSGKSPKEAMNISRRSMKFLMSAMGDGEEDSVVDEHYIDVALGSPTTFMKFVKVLMIDWGLKSSGVLSYLRTISDLIDYRKTLGLSDDVLRRFAVTEIYIRKCKSYMNRKKNMEYTRDLALENLIQKDQWTDLKQIESVIPFHTPKFTSIIKKCKEMEELSVSEKAAASRYVICFLFLRVKCTRSMSIQFLTLDMMKEAHRSGFVDQTQFKTAENFIFDSLKFSKDSLVVIDSYIQHVRPLCNPKCDFVLVTSKGHQYTAIGTAMSLLVQQAIGKFINPTRYRQIVETESKEKLSPRQQETISKDQKHSSTVAKRHYQKTNSREVAVQGQVCMDMLTGSQRSKHTSEIASELLIIQKNNEPAKDCQKSNEEAEVVLLDQVTDNGVEPWNAQEEGMEEDKEEVIVVESNSYEDRVNIEQLPCSSTYSIKDVDIDNCDKQLRDITNDKNIKGLQEVEVKLEDIEDPKRLTFTSEEDTFIKQGYAKYKATPSVWASILRDRQFKFHPSRKRDTIRVRATTLGLVKKRNPKKGRNVVKSTIIT